jgi:O-acetylserine/cysteine efflux transporter
MKPLDIALAIGIAVVWGLGFVITRFAVEEMSSSLLTTLRFAVMALPCVFLPRPKLAWPVLIGISLMLVIQFLSQTYGIAHGVPAGLTAVIVQSQALFTVAFAALIFSERPTRAQVVGIAISTCGLLMICGTVGYDFNPGPFVVVMIAPVAFAISNLLLRHARGVSMLDLGAWVALVAMGPLVATVWIADGPHATWYSLTHMSLFVALCVLFLGIVGTSFGYWVWGRLLHKYTAAQVVPFALLVPFVGAAGSSLAFGETFGPLRAAGMIVVVCGIAVMLFTGRTKTLPEVG